ncbi:MAG: methyltransferase domain-containing protein [Opitutaceae bacterium]
MENPVRTAEHLARIDNRRTELQSWCAKTLAARSRYILEIGCGNGHFLTAYAAAHPQDFCIGIDIERDRIERAQRKQMRARLSNLHFVRAEAALFLDAVPGPARAGAIYILFPDPWPKRRHHKNRLLTPPFLGRLADAACDGARLYFRTDYKAYYDEARAAAGAAPSWAIAGEEWPFEAQTVFQQRASEYHSFVAVRRPVRLSSGEP